MFEAELLAAQLHGNRPILGDGVFAYPHGAHGSRFGATCSCSSGRVTTSKSRCSAGEGLVSGSADLVPFIDDSPAGRSGGFGRRV